MKDELLEEVKALRSDVAELTAQTLESRLLLMTMLVYGLGDHHARAKVALLREEVAISDLLRREPSA